MTGTQPPGLSDAARDLSHDIARLDRQYRDEHGREPSGPELVLALARRYITARLKRGER